MADSRSKSGFSINSNKGRKRKNKRGHGWSRKKVKKTNPSSTLANSPIGNTRILSPEILNEDYYNIIDDTINEGVLDIPPPIENQSILDIMLNESHVIPPEISNFVNQQHRNLFDENAVPIDYGQPYHSLGSQYHEYTHGVINQEYISNVSNIDHNIRRNRKSVAEISRALTLLPPLFALSNNFVAGYTLRELKDIVIQSRLNPGVFYISGTSRKYIFHRSEQEARNSRSNNNRRRIVGRLTAELVQINSICLADVTFDDYVRTQNQQYNYLTRWFVNYGISNNEGSDLSMFLLVGDVSIVKAASFPGISLNQIRTAGFDNFMYEDVLLENIEYKNEKYKIFIPSGEGICVERLLAWFMLTSGVFVYGTEFNFQDYLKSVSDLLHTWRWESAKKNVANHNNKQAQKRSEENKIRYEYNRKLLKDQIGYSNPVFKKLQNYLVYKYKIFYSIFSKENIYNQDTLNNSLAIYKSNNYEGSSFNFQAFQISIDGEIYYSNKNHIDSKRNTGLNLLHVVGIWPPLVDDSEENILEFIDTKLKALVYNEIQKIKNTIINSDKYNEIKNSDNTLTELEILEKCKKSYGEFNSEILEKITNYQINRNKLELANEQNYTPIIENKVRIGKHMQKQRKERENMFGVFAFDIETFANLPGCQDVVAPELRRTLPDDIPNDLKESITMEHKQIAYTCQWTEVDLFSSNFFQIVIDGYTKLELLPITENFGKYLRLRRFLEPECCVDQLPVAIERGGVNKYAGKCVIDMLNNIFNYCEKENIDEGYLMSLNGSGFDHYIIKTALYDSNIILKDILQTPRGIISMTLERKVSNQQTISQKIILKFRDLKLFWATSLDSLAKSFKIPEIFYKKDFPISKIHARNYKDPLIMKAYGPYIAMDVISLAFCVARSNVIFAGIQNCKSKEEETQMEAKNIMGRYSSEIPPVAKFVTLMSMIQNIQNRVYKDSNVIVKPLNVIQLRKFSTFANVGGRVTPYWRAFSSKHLMKIMILWRALQEKLYLNKQKSQNLLKDQFNQTNNLIQDLQTKNQEKIIESPKIIPSIDSLQEEMNLWETSLNMDWMEEMINYKDSNCLETICQEYLEENPNIYRNQILPEIANIPPEYYHGNEYQFIEKIINDTNIKSETILNSIKDIYKKIIEENDYAEVWDINSHYPYSMSAYPMPTSIKKYINPEECKEIMAKLDCLACKTRMFLCFEHSRYGSKANELTFAYIFIDNLIIPDTVKNNFKNFIPRKIAEGGLLYSLENNDELINRKSKTPPKLSCYTHYDVFTMQKFGYVFDIIGGIEFYTSYADGDFLEKLFKQRTKAKESEKQNPEMGNVLSNMLKLVINGWYGVKGKKDINSEILVIPGDGNLVNESVLRKNGRIDPSQEIKRTTDTHEISNGQWIIKLSQTNSFCEYNKGCKLSPNHGAAACTAIARFHANRILMSDFIDPIDIGYTDTDSFLMHADLTTYLKKEKPWLYSETKLGAYKNDLGDGIVIASLICGKKVKLHITLNSKGELNFFPTFKGFNPNRVDNESGEKIDPMFIKYIIVKALSDIFWNEEIKSGQLTQCEWTRNLTSGIQINQNKPYTANRSTFFGHSKGGSLKKNGSIEYLIPLGSNLIPDFSYELSDEYKLNSDDSSNPFGINCNKRVRYWCERMLNNKFNNDTSFWYYFIDSIRFQMGVENNTNINTGLHDNNFEEELIFDENESKNFSIKELLEKSTKLTEKDFNW